MSDDLLLAHADRLATVAGQDVHHWRQIYQLIPAQVPLVDRCGHLHTPFRFKSVFTIPECPAGFNLGYHEIALARARELLELSGDRKLPLLVWYSGGIDSTLVLVCLLQTATTAEREQIHVALTDHSINENPAFYWNHIRGQLRTVNSERMLDIPAGRYIPVSGEFNDQLLGTDIYKRLIRWQNLDLLSQPYQEKLIVDFLQSMGMPQDSATIWYGLLHEQIRHCAPDDLSTVQDFFWWFNFCYKWQSVYFRVLLRSCHRGLLTPPQADDFCVHFFNTEDFQRWSMTNRHRKLRNTWTSYKYVAKDIIYEYTGDQDYLNHKVKMGSLVNVLRQRVIPDAYVWRQGLYAPEWNLDPEQFYQPNNSFV
jgi:hypothetical protein